MSSCRLIVPQQLLRLMMMLFHYWRLRSSLAFDSGNLSKLEWGYSYRSCGYLLGWRGWSKRLCKVMHLYHGGATALDCTRMRLCHVLCLDLFAVAINDLLNLLASSKDASWHKFLLLLQDLLWKLLLVIAGDLFLAIADFGLWLIVLHWQDLHRTAIATYALLLLTIV